MKILILLHVHSLLSLLYEGWADAESTGGLIHLWKQVVIIIIFIVVIIIVIIVAIDLHVEEGLILVSSPTRQSVICTWSSVLIIQMTEKYRTA